MTAVASLFDEMTLVVLEGRPRSGGSPLPRGSRVVALPIPPGRDWTRKFSLFFRLIPYVRALNAAIAEADVVHTPIPGDIPLLGMILALLRGKRLIARYGSSWFSTEETTFMNRVTRGIMRRFAGGRNVMLATGADGGQPAPGMHWLFATAISSEEVHSVRPDLGRGPSRPLRLIYPGRLSSEKGIEDLVEAMGHLEREAPGLAILTIAGDGPRRSWMEARLRELGCEKSVRFAGLLDRGGLLKELAGSDVCILPSLTESFCKARLDAMLCGVPVMTTEVGFGRTLVGADGERGWIVPVGDPRSIADAVAGVSRGSIDWPALRERCRRYVERFTLEEWARRIAGICSRQWSVPVLEGKLSAG